MPPVLEFAVVGQILKVQLPVLCPDQTLNYLVQALHQLIEKNIHRQIHSTNKTIHMAKNELAGIIS